MHNMGNGIVSEQADEYDVSEVIGRYDHLVNKRVLVTGGALGIGKAVALGFIANGARVAVMGRCRKRLELVAGQDGLAVVGDIRSVSDCRRAVAETVSAFGGLDILINNGGLIGEELDFDAEDVSGFEAAFQVYVGSAFALIKAAEAELIKSKGSIVNVSSMVNIAAPELQQSPYNVAKAAQDKMTQSLALHYAPYGVRVNSVQPAWVQTEAAAAAAARSQVSVEKFVSRARAVHPLGRISSPEEQAALIIFLSSSSAGFITGSCIHADGGLQLKSIDLPAWN